MKQPFFIYLGTPIHVDPIATDAFNALFRGHKWWVYLPKDLYEFDEELTCDTSCSDIVKYTNNEQLVEDRQVTLWYKHMLPQLR